MQLTKFEFMNEFNVVHVQCISYDSNVFLRMVRDSFCTEEAVKGADCVLPLIVNQIKTFLDIA